MEMLPKHQTKFSAGADLKSRIDAVINPGEVLLIGTGFYISDLSEKAKKAVKDFATVFVLCNRSSMAFKNRLIVMNGVGVIDADYGDEVKVMFMSLNDKPVEIKKGERIAQLIPMSYVAGIFDVEDNERNGGFGSTNE